MPGEAPLVLGGRYRLVRQLDQGGMGSVWYADHLVLNAPVAVKLLSFEAAAGGLEMQRFLREAQTAASLRSPHVVQILDYGVEGQTPCIVMELLVGESLASRLRRVRRLSPAETEAVITPVARAIGRAHEAGVVHRDLKPANVFVVRDSDVEVIKVLDFGIAKAPASAGTNTQSGAFLGTPAYASPEQTQGLTALDYRSDIWSLGVIAYECLLGMRPFNGDTLGAIAVAICAKPLPVPSTLGEVPAGFDSWFATACAREPERRFASAREAAEALSRICSGVTERAPAAPAVPLPQRDPVATLPEPIDTSGGSQGAASQVGPTELAPTAERSSIRWPLLAAVAAGLALVALSLRDRMTDSAVLSLSAAGSPSPAGQAAALAVPALPPTPPEATADAGLQLIQASEPPQPRRTQRPSISIVKEAVPPARPLMSPRQPDAKPRSLRPRPKRPPGAPAAASEPEVDLGL